MNSTARAANQTVFKESLLPDGKKRWGSFGAGFGLDSLDAVELVVCLDTLYGIVLDDIAAGAWGAAVLYGLRAFHVV